ncbi:MAG: PIN domain-containing protein [Armatimonadetes bacterium]|nr:PIN domain-containing protein [Armatimonadota bacterium]
MILVDTGALYALVDRNDVNHGEASKFYRGVAGKEILCISLPILTEAWLLIDARLGSFFANQLWKGICGGALEILPLEKEELQMAFEIESKYRDSGFGFIDATCFALCEKYKIRRVFTYDKKHFSIYRPRFTGNLELLP